MLEAVVVVVGMLVRCIRKKDTSFGSWVEICYHRNKMMKSLLLLHMPKSSCTYNSKLEHYLIGKRGNACTWYRNCAFFVFCTNMTITQPKLRNVWVPSLLFLGEGQNSKVKTLNVTCVFGVDKLPNCNQIQCMFWKIRRRYYSYHFSWVKYRAVQRTMHKWSEGALTAHVHRNFNSVNHFARMPSR